MTARYSVHRSGISAIFKSIDASKFARWDATGQVWLFPCNCKRDGEPDRPLWLVMPWNATFWHCSLCRVCASRPSMQERPNPGSPERLANRPASKVGMNTAGTADQLRCVVEECKALCKRYGVEQGAVGAALLHAMDEEKGTK